MKVIALLLENLIKITGGGGVNRIMAFFLRRLFGRCGKNVHFSPLSSQFSYSHIFLGSDIYIGPGALFSSIKKIEIADKVVFGPNVTIMGGDHNTKEIGKYILDVKNKNDDDDLSVIINKDVWVGCNVTILKGVVIGRGAIVAAGAVVCHDVPPYSIVAGVPARVIKLRWNGDIETIKKHERLLYAQDERLDLDAMIR